LQEDQERPIAPVGVSHLAREHGDALSVRRRMVEWDGELVLDQHQPGDHERKRHLSKQWQIAAVAITRTALQSPLRRGVEQSGSSSGS
jgi:hypothetical protein